MTYLTASHIIEQYNLTYAFEKKTYLRNHRELWYQQSLTSLCTIELIPLLFIGSEDPYDITAL